jgi:DNA-directed RNA polymerase subunit RPC12/RpoP
LSEAIYQKRKKTKQMLVIKLDLTKIDGNGDFSCPTCGVTISPEDETEDVYTIIEEKVRNDVLEELMIQCNACSSRICLTGFPTLEKDTSELE